jgi:UDP-galactose transporter
MEIEGVEGKRVRHGWTSNCYCNGLTAALSRILENSAGGTRAILLCLFLAIAGCSSAILTTLSRGAHGSYSYHSETVPLFAELLKLVVCGSIVYVQSVYTSGNTNSLPENGNPLAVYANNDAKKRATWIRYLVLGLLYSIQNNLVFVTLLYIDPGSMEVIGQLKIPLTAYLLYLVFHKRYRRMQIIGLSIITLGAVMVRLELVQCLIGHQEEDSVCGSAPIGVSLILIMCLISSCAGVANEYMLKKEEENGSLFWQNVQLYTSTILFNMLNVVFRNRNNSEFWVLKNIFHGYTWITWLLVFNIALVGIGVSVTLKFADNIVHVVGTALAMVFSMLFTVMMTEYILQVYAIIGIVMVLCGGLLYFGLLCGDTDDMI